MKKKHILIIHIGLILIALTLMIFSDHFEWDAIYVQLIPLILAMLPQYLPEKKEKEVHHYHVPKTDNLDEKTDALTMFYNAIKQNRWEEALEICFNPKYQGYLREYFYLSFKPHVSSNICTLKSQKFLFKLHSNPSISKTNEKEEYNFTKEINEFESVKSELLEDILKFYSDLLIDPQFELVRFQQMIDNNQVHTLMKKIDRYAKAFQPDIVIDKKVSKIKFGVTLRSFNNHTLSIRKDQPQSYRVQVTSHLDENKKKSTIGCQMEIDKKGNRSFHSKNGHHNPEYFNLLINSFFKQAKEDLL